MPTPTTVLHPGWEHRPDPPGQHRQQPAYADRIAALALHLVELPDPAGPDWDTRWLSEAELAWVATRRSPALRVRSQLSRLLIRAVLGELLGCDPARVPLTVTAAGRPVLAGAERVGAGRSGGDADVSRVDSFSVSHDGRHLLLAHRAGSCGVDLEDTDPALLHEVASRFCAPEERAGGQTAMDARALWCAKESVAKAYGTGLRAGLASITFDGDPRAGWATVLRHQRRTGLSTRVEESAERHLAVTVSGTAPAVGTLSRWRPGPGPAGRRLRRCGPPVEASGRWLAGLWPAGPGRPFPADRAAPAPPRQRTASASTSPGR